MLLTQLLVDEIRSLRRAKGEAAPASDGARVIRLAERAARSSAPVLIEGEPGTGGESVARAIHDCGDRRGRAFVRVHADHPEIGFVLFGDPRGCPPGRGKALEAHGGTLLIQAIELLPPDAQAALLRLIQDGEVEAPGPGKRPVKADPRVIATTSVDLMEQVREGRFREDLYYRLHVLPIGLRPLRARRDEIVRLAALFAARFAAEEGKPAPGLSCAAAALLCAYDWPGNLRQLENAVFRAVVLCEGQELTVAEFPQLAARVPGFAVDIPPLPASMPSAPIREFPRMELRDPHVLGLMDEDGELRSLEELEAEIIRFALAHYGGHMSAVSRRLGIGRSTLYRKLKDLGLENSLADAAA